MALPFSASAPAASYADVVLLVVRLVMGTTMIYYGWPKVRDPKKNAKDFEAMGFTPGVFWGSLILLVEFGGGIVVLLGVYAWAAAALIACHMATGTVWKMAKKRQTFPEWSYDLLVLTLSLVVLAFGPGRYALA